VLYGYKDTLPLQEMVREGARELGTKTVLVKGLGLALPLVKVVKSGALVGKVKPMLELKVVAVAAVQQNMVVLGMA
jgi:hypothetical protein